MKREVRDYIFDGMQTVPGWFRIADALIIAGIDGWQGRAGISGALAEIGIHFGRSYLLLALLARQNEGPFGIDLFQSYERATGEEQLGFLISRARDLGAPIDERRLFKGDSADFDPAVLFEAVGPVRLFSIDGGHYLHHLATDCAIADAVLKDDGVIVFDDYANAYWPEVTIGMFDFLRANRDRYAPFCVTRRKLYACRREHAHAYREAVRTAPEAGSLLRQTIHILDDEVVYALDGRKAAWSEEILQRLGMGWLSRAFFRRSWAA